jgi:hypothetical protein
MAEPIKSGVDTSEFRMTKLGIAIGVALQVLALVLEVLPQVAGEPSWLPKVTLIGGTILQAASIFGYQVSRGVAKAGAAAAPPATAPIRPTADAGTP